MGDIYLELTVANIHDIERQKEIFFLVDTGSTRAWISRKIADESGIQPAGTIPLEMADGSVKEFPYGFCLFDFGGETIAGNVVIGRSECEPIIGTHVLQDFRVVIDMERHTISRARAMKAKRGTLGRESQDDGVGGHARTLRAAEAEALDIEVQGFPTRAIDTTSSSDLIARSTERRHRCLRSLHFKRFTWPWRSRRTARSSMKPPPCRPPIPP